ncbi:MAG: hypothetical protein EXR71_15120 [Myxococcales bacterium]|nr:hypothetical protein [Myxococcales bacterium]
MPVGTVLAIVTLGLYAGCESEYDVTDNQGAQDDPNAAIGLEEIPADSGNTDNGIEDGIITGTVQVELYTYDAAGEMVWQEWEPVYGDDFPFGAIFVAAYKLDEESFSMAYLDQYVVRSPDPEGNTYELQVDPADASSVRVFAVLDYWADGILATTEPMGIWPDVIDVVAGAEVTGVDVDIPVPYYEFGGGGGGGGGNGVGGGGGGGEWNRDDYVLISGAGLITESYAGGSCMALLYGSDGTGPYYADGFTPTRTDDGAEGTYAMWVAKNYGVGELLGAWDSNFNGLIDPADRWGGYVDSTGASLNPISIGTADMPDSTLMIPDGNNSNPSAVPFVLLAGDVTISGGFDALEPGAQVHVAAMKFRPEDDLSVADIPAIAYDYQTYAGADVTGSALSFTLIAPANTIVYLWAYLDAEGDGVINEAGEAVASYGNNPAGHLPTGSESHLGLEMPLVTVTE